MVLKIDLGCGESKRKGYLGVDRLSIQGVDVHADLNEKLPFKNDIVDMLYSAHAIEYVNELDNIFSEIYRICKNGAIVEIILPHFSSYTAYHCNVRHIFRWYEGLGDYCISNHNHLGKKYFKLITSKLRLEHHLKWLDGFVNLIPRFYERTFLKALLPTYEIYFRLQVVKGDDEE